MKYYSWLICVLMISCTTKKTENTDSTAPVDAVTITVDTVSTTLTTNQDESTNNEEAPSEDGSCACNVDAYLDDPDASGTNIRETPKGKIIGQLHYETDCDCLTVSFVESKGGWMKLTEGGWVLGKLFSVDTRNYGPGQKIYLQADPTEESEVVAEFDTEKTFRVKGCCGSWLQVEDSGGKTGWLTGEMACANPLTTCS
jgi:hypothetical protein